MGLGPPHRADSLVGNRQQSCNTDTLFEVNASKGKKNAGIQYQGGRVRKVGWWEHRPWCLPQGGGYHQLHIFEQYEPTKSLFFITTMYQ